MAIAKILRLFTFIRVLKNTYDQCRVNEIVGSLFSLIGIDRGDLVTVDGGVQSLSDREAEVVIRREGDCFSLRFPAHREIAWRFSEHVVEGCLVRLPPPEKRIARTLR